MNLQPLRSYADWKRRSQISKEEHKKCSPKIWTVRLIQWTSSADWARNPNSKMSNCCMHVLSLSRCLILFECVSINFKFLGITAGMDVKIFENFKDSRPPGAFPLSKIFAYRYVTGRQFKRARVLYCAKTRRMQANGVMLQLQLEQNAYPMTLASFPYVEYGLRYIVAEADRSLIVGSLFSPLLLYSPKKINVGWSSLPGYIQGVFMQKKVRWKSLIVTMSNVRLRSWTLKMSRLLGSTWRNNVEEPQAGEFSPPCKV